MQFSASHSSERLVYDTTVNSANSQSPVEPCQLKQDGDKSKIAYIPYLMSGDPGQALCRCENVMVYEPDYAQRADSDQQ